MQLAMYCCKETKYQTLTKSTKIFETDRYIIIFRYYAEEALMINTFCGTALCNTQVITPHP